MTDTKNPPQLSTVHDAVIDAKLSDPRKMGPSVCKSFRVDEDVFHLAQEICERNGTSVSEFCRTSLTRLVTDYQSRREP